MMMMMMMTGCFFNYFFNKKEDPSYNQTTDCYIFQGCVGKPLPGTEVRIMDERKHVGIQILIDLSCK